MNDDYFVKKKWKMDKSSGIREWYADILNSKIDNWPWNNTDKREVSIIPVIHGTNFSTAVAICSSGFATLSVIDAGWYGAGIYFTSHVPYATPYFSRTSDPAVIIAYILPGNSYPACEDPCAPGSLVEQSIKPGYQSHYVVTKCNGYPVQKQVKSDYFDEIVVNQEAQICPAFIVKIDKSCIKSLEGYLREIPDGLSSNLVTEHSRSDSQ